MGKLQINRYYLPCLTKFSARKFVILNECESNTAELHNRRVTLIKLQTSNIDNFRFGISLSLEQMQPCSIFGFHPALLPSWNIQPRCHADYRRRLCAVNSFSEFERVESTATSASSFQMLFSRSYL